MRIWITGAGGLMGRALLDAFRGESLLPTYHARGAPRVDLADGEAVLRFASEGQPEIVVHAAAVTDVDRCERERDRALRANTGATANVAWACSELGIPMVYLSTDFVFDGRLGRPYAEKDRPHPVNYYGWTKLLGEEHVRRLGTAWIVRTQWLFGPTEGFPHRILAAARAGGRLRAVTDQIGCPTSASDLAGALVTLVHEAPCGLYHLTNSEYCSKYDLARESLRLAGMDADSVEPCRTADFPTPARRPTFTALENARWRSCGLPPLRPWREALEEALKPRS